eukprot:m.150745 g.150745  ORF g.150745 m.150745 type:complete len:131 (+) comp30741_c2_seq4:561-953(+)
MTNHHDSIIRCSLFTIYIFFLILDKPFLCCTKKTIVVCVCVVVGFEMVWCVSHKEPLWMNYHENEHRAESAFCDVYIYTWMEFVFDVNCVQERLNGLAATNAALVTKVAQQTAQIQALQTMTQKNLLDVM